MSCSKSTKCTNVLFEITTSGSIVRTGDLLAMRGDIVTEEIIDEVHTKYS